MDAPRTFNLGRINAVCLALVCPLLVRFWIEAVVWRIGGGPQMIGFSLVHAGAGLLTPILILGLLVAPLYIWGGGVMVIAHVFPAVRARLQGGLLVALGVAAVGAFTLGVDAMQSPGLPAAILYSGGFVLATIIASVCVLAVVSWRSPRYGRT